MTRILYTQGDGVFKEKKFAIPHMQNNEIRVKSVMTGVCRSDIAMMNGEFGPLPLHMQGHEGLAQVIEIGNNVSDVNVGDYVATRGEPAYADIYNVKPDQWIVVPEADPKWILEPVACGINCVLQARNIITMQSYNNNPKAVIIGSGFLAKVVLQTFKILFPDINVDVIGSSNKEWFSNQGNELLIDFDGTYDIVVDLKEDDRVFNTDCINENAIIIMATEKPRGIDTTLANMLWKAVTMIFPSPRAPTFYEAMILSKTWIENAQLDVENFWTREYNRDTEWQQAFEDGNNRQGNYSRGYIKWD